MTIFAKQRCIKMNKDKLNKLSVVISGALNNSISHLNTKEKLACIIGDETPSDALSDLSKISYENSQQKNKAVVIVVLGYLYFNADLKNNLKEAIINNNLEKCYYGGIRTLILGNSKSFKIDVKINDDNFENKLRYIYLFDPEYIQFFQLFLLLEILNEINQNDFEKILIEDDAIYFLLSACQHYISFKPSDDFIKHLLNSQNEIQRNIAFDYIVHPVKNYINGEHRDNLDESTMEVLLTDFYNIFDFVDKKYAVSLLFNYILTESCYPTDFVHRISQKEYSKELCFELNQSNKIKLVKDLYNVASAINDFDSLNNTEISNAVVECLKRLFDKDYFYYEYERQDKTYTEKLIRTLPKSQQLSLKEYFIEYDGKLMISKLDRMVRNKFYTTDIKKHNCIHQIVRFIDEIQ